MSLKKAVQIDPLFIEASLNLAATLADTSQYTLAEKTIKESQRLHTSSSQTYSDPLIEELADKHVSCGQTYASLGRLDEAAREFKIAINLCDHSPFNRLELAKIYISQKKTSILLV